MSSHTSLTDGQPAARKPVTLIALRAMHERGEKIAMLTAYDATFARVLDDAGIDVVLVGDSLGNVMQGQASTLPVTLQDMVYHTQCVARGLRAAWLISDLPFGSYHEGIEQAIHSSVALMRAGAHMVKLEGGETWAVDAVAALVQRSIPVCAHLGFTPQSKYALGGYRVQGRDEDGAGLLKRRARALAEAGATMLVLEMVPAALAKEIQAENPQLMTIGIGAGPDTAGQVLVLHDMLGASPGKMPRFVRNFLQDAPGIDGAIRAYIAAVKNGSFPDPAVHTY